MFQKGRDRRQNRRADRKEKRAERREKRGGKPSNAAIGVAVGGAIAATAVGVNAYQKNKAKKEAQEAAAATTSTAGYSSDDYSVDTADGFEIMHPSEYTVQEVQFFLMAIGLEKYCDCFETKQINGQIMISMTQVQLQEECGMTTVEIKKFYLALEFQFEVAEGSKDDPEKPTCKPPKQWTEIEVCLVLVSIGLGYKVEEFKKCQVSGAMVVSMTKVEIEKECGMTTVEVQRFQAVIVKGKGGGCGIEPEVDTMPIDQSELPNVESGGGGPNKGAVIGIAVGGAIIAGGIGYWAWKKNQNKEEISTMPIEQPELKEEEVSTMPIEQPDLPPCHHPCNWTQIEVRFFLIAIGLESKCPTFEENGIDGQMLVKLTKTELEVDLGCSSIQIRKFTASLEFAIQVSEDCEKPQEPPQCKPPQDWSEVEICIILVVIGCGKRVEECKKAQISGAMAVSMTKVEIQEECGMTSVEVKQFKAVVVKK